MTDQALTYFYLGCHCSLIDMTPGVHWVVIDVKTGWVSHGTARAFDEALFNAQMAATKMYTRRNAEQ